MYKIVCKCINIILNCRLDQKLLWPFRQLKATAIKKFDAKESDQVSLKEDQKLIVIYKEGYREGWWKVRTDTNEVNMLIKNYLIGTFFFIRKNYINFHIETAAKLR